MSQLRLEDVTTPFDPLCLAVVPVTPATRLSHGVVRQPQTGGANLFCRLLLDGRAWNVSSLCIQFSAVCTSCVISQDMDEREGDIKLMREELEGALEKEKEADGVLKVLFTRTIPFKAPCMPGKLCGFTLESTKRTCVLAG